MYTFHVEVQSVDGALLCVPVHTRDAHALVPVPTVKRAVHDHARDHTAPPEHMRLFAPGRELADGLTLVAGAWAALPPLHAALRVCGGKGGFGALLRGQKSMVGAKKTTNFDACRDLHGRRIRHARNAKRLREWEEQGGYERVKRERAEARKREREERERAAGSAALRRVHSASKEVGSKVRSAMEEGVVAARALERERRAAAEAQRAASAARDRALHVHSSIVLEEGGSSSSPLPTTTASSPLPTRASKEEEEEKGEEKEAGDAAEKEEEEGEKEEGEEAAAEEKKDGAGGAEPLVDLAAVGSVEELCALGLDALKRALQGLGQRCGGTLEERAQRLWAARALLSDGLVPDDPRLRVKKKKKNKKNKKKGKGKAT